MAARVTVRCPRGGYKFIVIENERDEMIVYADDEPRFDYHRELLAEYRHESGLRARCIGGGRISFKETEKVIRIWDSSGDFGYEPDRNVTLAALKLAYPGFDVSER